MIYAAFLNKLTKGFIKFIVYQLLIKSSFVTYVVVPFSLFCYAKIYCPPLTLLLLKFENEQQQKGYHVISLRGLF